jgi:hypothetical protein
MLHPIAAVEKTAPYLKPQKFIHNRSSENGSMRFLCKLITFQFKLSKSFNKKTWNLTGQKPKHH